MRKLAIVSGHRAERGHIDAIVAGVAAHPGLSYALLEIPLAAHDGTLAGEARAMARTMETAVDAIAAAETDMVLVYGDRSEALIAVLAASRLGLAVCHVEGGDVTEGGCLDDTARHAISKLAHVHFATNERSAAHLVSQLGEEAWRVYNVGLPILDLVEQRTPEDEIRSKYELDPEKSLIVFCQHPVAMEVNQYAGQLSASCAALLMLEDYIDLVTIGPNGDAGSHGYCWPYPNVSRADYHGLLALASAVVGNSSAGLKEAPAFNCPCVNIGNRQRGRLRGDNVIDVPHDAEAIYSAINVAIMWKWQNRTFTNPYGSGNAGTNIANVLASISLAPRLRQKRAA